MNSPFATNRIDYVINLLNPQKKDKVLMIGVSNIPEIEIKVEKIVKECWTIDIDRKKLEKAGKHLKKTKLILSDINNPKEIKKKYFDKIIMLEVLEHLKDDSKILGIINGLLKKDGELILSVPNNHPLHIINPVKHTQHERHYSNNQIKNLLKVKGFKIIHFNIVESGWLLANLYIHLFFKYLLLRKKRFGFLGPTEDKTYKQINQRGLGIIVKARKIKDILKNS